MYDSQILNQTTAMGQYLQEGNPVSNTTQQYKSITAVSSAAANNVGPSPVGVQQI